MSGCSPHGHVHAQINFQSARSLTATEMVKSSGLYPVTSKMSPTLKLSKTSGLNCAPSFNGLVSKELMSSGFWMNFSLGDQRSPHSERMSFDVRNGTIGPELSLDVLHWLMIWAPFLMTIRFSVF